MTFTFIHKLLSPVKLHSRLIYDYSLRLWICGIHTNPKLLCTSNQPDEIHDQSDEKTLFIKRGIPLSTDEYSARRLLEPSQPADPHILKVTLLGEPNVGKSTLTNRLMKWRVSAVSKKVHTTRKKSTSILTKDNKQIVFLDTPGFVTPEHSRRHHLEISLVADPAQSVRDSDLVAVIIDASCKWTNKRINEEILTLLDGHKDKKSILILNKVDAQKSKSEIEIIERILTRGAIEGEVINPITLAKRQKMLLKRQKKKEVNLNEMFEKTERVLANKSIPVEEPVPEMLTHHEGAKGWPFFSKSFIVSALKGDGVDDLREYMFELAKPGNWIYHDTHVLDKHPHEIASMTVREVLLENLPQEVPYELGLKIKSWNVDDTSCLRIHMAIGCTKRRHKHMLIGHGGGRISKIVEQARQALQDTFRCEIYLRLGIE